MTSQNLCLTLFCDRFVNSQRIFTKNISKYSSRCVDAKNGLGRTNRTKTRRAGALRVRHTSGGDRIYGQQCIYRHATWNFIGELAFIRTTNHVFKVRGAANQSKPVQTSQLASRATCSFVSPRTNSIFKVQRVRKHRKPAFFLRGTTIRLHKSRLSNILDVYWSSESSKTM